MLESHEDFAVVGVAGCDAECLSAVGRLDPDIVIVSTDVTGGVSGFVAGLRDFDPELAFRVVIFGRLTDSEAIVDCLRAGVSGFVEDDVPCDLLPAELRQFAAGQPVLGASTISVLLDVVTQNPATPHETNFEDLSKLTSQERKVLDLMGQGIPTAQMADMLQLGETTVRTHVHRMKVKLGLRTRDQLIVFAVRSTPITDSARI